MRYILILILLTGCFSPPAPTIITPMNYYQSIEEFSRMRGALEYKEAVIIHLRDIGTVNDIEKVDSIYINVQNYYIELEESISK